jgi:hypothetical protein
VIFDHEPDTLFVTRIGPSTEKASRRDWKLIWTGASHCGRAKLEVSPPPMTARSTLREEGFTRRPVGFDFAHVFIPKPSTLSGDMR